MYYVYIHIHNNIVNAIPCGSAAASVLEDHTRSNASLEILVQGPSGSSMSITR